MDQGFESFYSDPVLKLLFYGFQQKLHQDSPLEQ